MKNSKAIDWILRFVKGMFIGTGFILPGVSGGALAAIFGIYERIISFISHITKDFWKNVLYFIPVGLGGIVSVVLCSFALSFFFDSYKVEILWFFVGCILGTLPLLWKQAGKKGRNGNDIAVLAVSAVCGYGVLFFAKDIIGNVSANFGTWIIAGAIIALGVLVPGLSPSNFLFYMGLFEPMTNAIKSLDMLTIIPICIGGLACVFAFSRLVDMLIQKAYKTVFHVIFGIVLASTVMILPLPFNYEFLELTYNYFSVGTVICAVACILGVALGYWMGGLEEKYKPE